MESVIELFAKGLVEKWCPIKCEYRVGDKIVSDISVRLLSIYNYYSLSNRPIEDYAMKVIDVLFVLTGLRRVISIETVLPEHAMIISEIYEFMVLHRNK